MTYDPWSKIGIDDLRCRTPGCREEPVAVITWLLSSGKRCSGGLMCSGHNSELWTQLTKFPGATSTVIIVAKPEVFNLIKNITSGDEKEAIIFGGVFRIAAADSGCCGRPQQP